MADLISVSANEIRSTVLKACVGCRVERGVASEIADAVALVGSHGIDLSSDLVGALDAFPAATGKHAQWLKHEDGGCSAERAHVLIDGPSMVDFCMLYGRATAMLDSGSLLLAVALMRSVGSARIGDGIIEPLSPARLTEPNVPVEVCLVAEGGTSLTAGGERPHVNAEAWEHLKLHAAKILVPADASNLADAGAGTTDND